MLKQGERIVYLGDFGTVQYIGPLKHNPNANQKEEWACIEWDELKRGKHDGVVEGYTYFKSTKDNCSLMKVEKLGLGKKFSEALDEKYKPTEENINELKDLSNLFVYTTSLKKKNIEMVGIDKALAKYGDYASLYEVALQNHKIREIDASITTLIPKVRHLYLEANLLYSWDQFFMLAQLPRLEFISVSYNRLKMCADMEAHKLKGVSKSIKSMSFIGMSLKWEDVTQLSWCFDEVEELWLCKNECTKISSLPEKIDTKHMGKLKLLNIEENLITDWEELSEFKKLPCLDKLVVNKNALISIGYVDGFQHLKSLSVSKNDIKKYKFINMLNKFPVLEKLRLADNPINMMHGDKKCRYNIIARIRNLKAFNGSTITKVERKDSEIVYLRECYEDYKASGESNLEAFMQANHPRWIELIKYYGSPIEMVQQKVDVMKGSMSINSINVSFYLETKVDAKIAKKIPLSLTVRVLKGLCIKLFGLNCADVKLLAMDGANKIPLDDDMKQLSFYPIKECKEIVIQL